MILCKYCIVSVLPFILRRTKRETFLPVACTKWLDTPSKKSKAKLKIKFWKLVLSMSSIKYAVDKLHNRFTVSSHFVLTDKLSLTGREFCLLAHLPILMMKVKYEIKQICTILFLYVLEFVEIFHLPKVRQ